MSISPISFQLPVTQPEQLQSNLQNRLENKTETDLPSLPTAIEGDCAIVIMKNAGLGDDQGILNAALTKGPLNKLTSSKRQKIADFLTHPFEVKTSVDGEEFSFEVFVTPLEIYVEIHTFIKKNNLELKDIFLFGSSVLHFLGYDGISDNFKAKGISLERLFSQEYLAGLKKEYDERPNDFDILFLFSTLTNADVENLKNIVVSLIRSKVLHRSKNEAEYSAQKKANGLRLMKEKFAKRGISDKYPFLTIEHSHFLEILVKELAFEKLFQSKSEDPLHSSIATLGDNKDTIIEFNFSLPKFFLSLHKSLCISIQDFVNTLDVQNPDNPPLIPTIPTDNCQNGLQSLWDNVIKVFRPNKNGTNEIEFEFFTREIMKGYRSLSSSLDQELKAIFLQKAVLSKNVVNYFYAFISKSLKTHYKNNPLASFPLILTLMRLFNDDLSQKEKIELIDYMLPFWKYVDNSSSLQNSSWSFLSKAFREKKVNVETLLDFLQVINNIQLYLSMPDPQQPGLSKAYLTRHNNHHISFFSIKGDKKTFWFPLSKPDVYFLSSFLKMIDQTNLENHKLLTDIFLSFFHSFSFKHSQAEFSEIDKKFLDIMTDLSATSHSPLVKLMTSMFILSHPHAYRYPLAIETILTSLPKILTIVSQNKFRTSLIAGLLNQLKHEPWLLQNHQIEQLSKDLNEPFMHEQELVKGWIETLKKLSHPPLDHSVFSIWQKEIIPSKLFTNPEKQAFSETLFTYFIKGSLEHALDILIHLQKEGSYPARQQLLGLNQLCLAFSQKSSFLPTSQLVDFIKNLLLKKKNISSINSEEISKGKALSWLSIQLSTHGYHETAYNFLLMASQKSLISDPISLEEAWYSTLDAILDDSQFPLKLDSVWQEAKRNKAFPLENENYWKLVLKTEKKSAAGRFVSGFDFKSVPSHLKELFENLHVEHLKQSVQKGFIVEVRQDLENGQAAQLSIVNQNDVFQSIFKHLDNPIESFKILLSLTKQAKKSKKFDLIVAILNEYLHSSLYRPLPESAFEFFQYAIQLLKENEVINLVNPSLIANLLQICTGIASSLDKSKHKQELSVFVEAFLIYTRTTEKAPLLDTLYFPLNELIHSLFANSTLAYSLKDEFTKSQAFLFEKLAQNNHFTLICQLVLDTDIHKIALSKESTVVESVYQALNFLFESNNSTTIMLIHSVLNKFPHLESFSIEKKKHLYTQLISKQVTHYFYEESVLWMQKISHLSESFPAELLKDGFVSMRQLIKDRKPIHVNLILEALKHSVSLNSEEWNSLSVQIVQFIHSLITEQKVEWALQLLDSLTQVDHRKEKKEGEHLSIFMLLTKPEQIALQSPSRLKKVALFLKDSFIILPSFTSDLIESFAKSQERELKEFAWSLAKEVLNNEESVENYQKFIPDLLLNSIKCLKGLDYMELLFLLRNPQFQNLIFIKLKNHPSLPSIIKELIPVISLMTKKDKQTKELFLEVLPQIWKLHDLFKESSEYAIREEIDTAMIILFTKHQNDELISAACDLLLALLPNHPHFAILENSPIPVLFDESLDETTPGPIEITGSQPVLKCSENLRSVIDVLITHFYKSKTISASLTQKISLLTSLVRLYHPLPDLLMKCITLSVTSKNQHLDDMMLTVQCLVLQMQSQWTSKEIDFLKNIQPHISQIFTDAINSEKISIHVQVSSCLKSNKISLFLSPLEIVSFSIMILLTEKALSARKNSALNAQNIKGFESCLSGFAECLTYKGKIFADKYFDFAFELLFILAQNKDNIFDIVAWMNQVDSVLWEKLQPFWEMGWTRYKSQKLKENSTKDDILLLHIKPFFNLLPRLLRFGNTTEAHQKSFVTKLLNSSTKYIELALLNPILHKPIEQYFLPYFYKQLIFSLTEIGISAQSMTIIQKTILIAEKMNFFVGRNEICREINLLFWPLLQTAICGETIPLSPVEHTLCVTKVLKRLSFDPTFVIIDYALNILKDTQERSLKLNAEELEKCYLILISCLNTIDPAEIMQLFQTLNTTLDAFEKKVMRGKDEIPAHYPPLFFRIKQNLLKTATANSPLSKRVDYSSDPELEEKHFTDHETIRLSVLELFEKMPWDLNYTQYLDSVSYYFILLKQTLAYIEKKSLKISIDELIKQLINLVEMMPEFLKDDMQAKIKRGLLMNDFIHQVYQISSNPQWYVIAKNLLERAITAQIYTQEEILFDLDMELKNPLEETFRQFKTL